MRHRRAIEMVAEALRGHYGPALDSIVVFGSVARERAGDESDVDILVVLDQADRETDWRTEREVRSLVYPVELDQNVVFDLKVMDRASLSGPQGHTPFMERVAAEGVRI
jgi:predicted nucleotidyltransferase